MNKAVPAVAIRTEVTSEEWDYIRAELEKLLKTKQKKGEDLETYARRLALTVSDEKKVSDDEWNSLDEDRTQKWVNGAVVATEKGEPIPLPPGSTGEADEADEPAAESAASAARRATAEPKKEPKAASKKEPKAAPKKAEAPASRGRPSKYSEDDVIRLLEDANPHRKGSRDYDKYKKLRDGQTVGKALRAGVELGYIRYLERRGLIKIDAGA